ncbi:AMP-binding protein [Nocardia sp. CA-145437]|uniref:AMP-binding protein n=1 Tax=Nocardia sp. CA-145437 TaxID=3239980 RepID=UPI003D974B83
MNPSARSALGVEEKPVLAGGTPAALLDRLTGYRHAVHFPESGAVLAYRNIPELAYGLAQDLVVEGVESGDIVGILAPACPGFFQAYFGAIAAGAGTCVLPVPSLGADLAERLAPMLTATGIRYVVVADAFGGFAEALSRGANEWEKFMKRSIGASRRRQGRFRA